MPRRDHARECGSAFLGGTERGRAATGAGGIAALAAALVVAGQTLKRERMSRHEPSRPRSLELVEFPHSSLSAVESLRLPARLGKAEALVVECASQVGAVELTVLGE